MTYKKRIMLLDLSRKELAAQLGLTYSAFTARLNEFTPFRPDEERRLQKILEEAEKQKLLDLQDETDREKRLQSMREELDNLQRKLTGGKAS